MKRKVPESVGGCYSFIETRMLRGPWVMGESYTIADPYLFTIAQWLEDDGVDSRTSSSFWVTGTISGRLSVTS
jgi:glutathione S-transferase